MTRAGRGRHRALRRSTSARFLATLVSGALAAALAAAPAEAQEPPVFTGTLYGGWSWTTPWMEWAGEDFSIGENPMFGATGTFWFAPRWGIRGHVGHLRSGAPEPDVELEDFPHDVRLRTWLYDLSVAFRPFATRPAPSLVRSSYLFLGGGAVTVLTDDGGEDCLPPFDRVGACLPTHWRDATVGQLTAGVGTAWTPRGWPFGFAFEIGRHWYGSPFESGFEFAEPHIPEGVEFCPTFLEECLARDRSAATTRAFAGLFIPVGRRPREVLPPGVPPPPPAVPPPPPERLVICIVEEGLPRWVDAWRDPDTGRLMTRIEGEVRPVPEGPAYAAETQWYRDAEPIAFGDRRWIRFGLARELDPDELRRVGEYREVPVFIREETVEVIYLPVGQRCEFQPYQPEVEVREVRGG
jgi:hypothetical protein